jgi:hypothetical protein
VLLHIQRLGLDLPLRATGDADIGVPLHLLRNPELVDALEELGYTKVAGNRWERRIDDRRVASVDLLVSTVTLPDALAMLTLKALVRSVRHEDRDAQDLWRCLEIAAAEGITSEAVTREPGAADMRELLQGELGPRGE